MSERPPALAGVLWATRGRIWGFRFLLDAGLDDPLSAYEEAFADLGDHPSGRVGDAHQIAVRFPDPHDRRDRSGRTIPHDFVVAGVLATQIATVDDALKTLWPLVADTYALVWDRDHPPTTDELLW